MKIEYSEGRLILNGYKSDIDPRGIMDIKKEYLPGVTMTMVIVDGYKLTTQAELEKGEQRLFRHFFIDPVEASQFKNDLESWKLSADKVLSGYEEGLNRFEYLKRFASIHDGVLDMIKNDYDPKLPELKKPDEALFNFAKGLKEGLKVGKQLK